MKEKTYQNMKTLAIVGVVTVVALAGILYLTTDNGIRNQVPIATTEEPTVTDPTEAAAPTTTQEGVTTQAQALFDARVDTINNTDAVAKLLETINLRENIAVYTSSVLPNQTPKTLKITFSKVVNEADRITFNANVQKYAIQILALIADAQQVKWIYTVQTNTGQTIRASGVTSVSDSNPLLKENIKQYGASPADVQKLLNVQMGL